MKLGNVRFHTNPNHDMPWKSIQSDDEKGEQRIKNVGIEQGFCMEFQTEQNMRSPCRQRNTAEGISCFVLPYNCREGYNTRISSVSKLTSTMTPFEKVVRWMRRSALINSCFSMVSCVRFSAWRQVSMTSAISPSSASISRY